MTTSKRFVRHCEKRSDEATFTHSTLLHQRIFDVIAQTLLRRCAPRNDVVFGLICLTLVSFQTAWADSAPLYESHEAISVLHDSIDRERLLLLGADSAKVFDLRTLRVVTEYSIRDRACTDASVFAFPFLSSLVKTCRIDEAEKTIVDIGDIPLPHENTFAYAYFGENEDAVFFVMNGRPWETEGFIKVKSIRKRDNTQATRDLYSGVPGYSGAMFHDREAGYFYHTMATGGTSNILYRIPSNEMDRLITEGANADFRATFERWHGPFSGLSFQLFVGPTHLLYVNPGFESYTVRKLGGAREKMEIPNGCTGVGSKAEEWILLCENRVLRLK